MRLGQVAGFTGLVHIRVISQENRLLLCGFVTLTLVSHCLTAVKLCSAVTSYITITPSALRKNCLVMLRYLQEEQEVDYKWTFGHFLPSSQCFKLHKNLKKAENFHPRDQNFSKFPHFHNEAHLSCPAVSHNCSATWLLSTVIVFTL